MKSTFRHHLHYCAQSVILSLLFCTAQIGYSISDNNRDVTSLINSTISLILPGRAL